MQALIDGDLVAYRCAATCQEDDTPDIAFLRMNELVERILASVNATSYTIYLSGGDNFRKKIDPQYKANRKDTEKPKWLEQCREYLVLQWNAKLTDGIEADDALGIAQQEDTVICSLDKDLLQVPGNHFQWSISGRTATGTWEKPDTFYTISEEEGLKRFYTQMLVGDVSDNIFGIRGIGPVKAAKILDQIEGDTLEQLEDNYYSTVAQLYADEDRLHRNAKLLWILRSAGGVWLNPQERLLGQKEESNLSSPVSCEEVVDVGPQSISV